MRKNELIRVKKKYGTFGLNFDFLEILANFIPERNMNFESFFLEIIEKVPDSTSMPRKKSLNKKTARKIFSPRKKKYFRNFYSKRKT